MIYGKFVQWSVKLLHVPTGITVETDSTVNRKESMHSAKERAMKRLKSRVWAEQNLPKPDARPVFNYDLDRAGLGPYPNDLEDAKRQLASPPGES